MSIMPDGVFRITQIRSVSALQHHLEVTASVAKYNLEATRKALDVAKKTNADPKLIEILEDSLVKTSGIFYEHIVTDSVYGVLYKAAHFDERLFTTEEKLSGNAFMQDVVQHYSKIMLQLKENDDNLACKYGYTNVTYEHLNWMLLKLASGTVENHRRPFWVGFIQGVLQVRGVVTSNEEQAFMEKMYAKYYVSNAWSD